MLKYVDLKKFCDLILWVSSPEDVACSSGKNVFTEGFSSGLFNYNIKSLCLVLTLVILVD